MLVGEFWADGEAPRSSKPDPGKGSVRFAPTGAVPGQRTPGNMLVGFDNAVEQDTDGFPGLVLTVKLATATD